MEPLETPQANPEPGAAKQQLQQNWVLFAVGFFGWYLINGLFWLSIWNPENGPMPLNFNGSFAPGFYNFCLLPANGLALLILGILPRTRLIALGVLAALALNLAISLLLGLTLNAVCFLPFFIKTQ